MVFHSEINDWILENIQQFKIWHHPIDFGGGVIIHCTDEKNNPTPEWDNFHGINKWNKMIKPFVKSVKNKRILDLGCNTGIIDIELCKLGVKEVIGIDKGKPFFLGQDYVEQAKFVKEVFELRNEKMYPISYVPCDLNNIEQFKNLNLGFFDIVFAFRVLNYIKNKIPQMLKTLSDMTNMIVIQTNLEGYWEKDPYSKVDYYVENLEKNGFKKTVVKIPKEYEMYPVIIGKK